MNNQSIQALKNDILQSEVIYGIEVLTTEGVKIVDGYVTDHDGVDYVFYFEDEDGNEVELNSILSYSLS